MAHPLPELQLLRQQYRRVVNDARHRLHLVALGLLVVQSSHNGQVRLGPAEGHAYTDAHLYPVLQHRRHSVGEHPLKGYGQYDVNVIHSICKDNGKRGKNKNIFPLFFGFSKIFYYLCSIKSKKVCRVRSME